MMLEESYWFMIWYDMIYEDIHMEKHATSDHTQTLTPSGPETQI